MGQIYFIITIYNSKYSQMWKVTYSTKEQIFYLKGVRVTRSGTHDHNMVNISDKLRSLRSRVRRHVSALILSVVTMTTGDILLWTLILEP